MTAIPPVLQAETPPSLRSRRRTGSVIVSLIRFFFIVFVGGGLIAPRLYTGVQFLAELVPAVSFIANQPFHRFVNQCFFIVALLALPSFLKGVGIQTAGALGLKWGLRHWVEGMQGLAWGFVALAFAATLFVGLQVRVLDLDHTSAQWIQHLKNAALSALVVALLEELIFRGALFGGMRRSHRFWFAALLSAAIYAILHFFERPESHGRIHWDSGLLVLTQMMRGFTEPEVLIPTFLNLTLLGLLLALVFERTGALHFSIGLHAGLVFWVKTFTFVTNSVPDSRTSFWGTDKLIDGWMTGLLLLLVFILIERTLPPRKVPEA